MQNISSTCIYNCMRGFYLFINYDFTIKDSFLMGLEYLVYLPTFYNWIILEFLSSLAGKFVVFLS